MKEYTIELTDEDPEDICQDLIEDMVIEAFEEKLELYHCYVESEHVGRYGGRDYKVETNIPIGSKVKILLPEETCHSQLPSWFERTYIAEDEYGNFLAEATAYFEITSRADDYVNYECVT